jgi:hypothetical protein
MTWLGVIAAVVIGQAPPPAPVAAPAPPPPAAQPQPTLAPPVAPVAPVDEEGAPVQNGQANIGESQIRTNFQTAEAARGSLDGRWRLTLPDGGQTLFVFQFSDSGGAPDARATTPMSPQVEGAWRDMRRPDALNASGMFETVRRDGARLTIVFDEGQPPQAQSLILQPVGAAWTGDLTIGGVETKVAMTRE